MDDFWDNRAERVQSIENSGYVIVLPPEKTQIGGKEYVKYIVSLANERGAAFENSYFGVLIRQASDKERIFTTIRFDGTDMDALNAEQKMRFMKSFCTSPGDSRQCSRNRGNQ